MKVFWREFLLWTGVIYSSIVHPWAHDFEHAVKTHRTLTMTITPSICQRQSTFNILPSSSRFLWKNSSSDDEKSNRAWEVQTFCGKRLLWSLSPQCGVCYPRTLKVKSKAHTGPVWLCLLALEHFRSSIYIISTAQFTLFTLLFTIDVSWLLMSNEVKMESGNKFRTQVQRHPVNSINLMERQSMSDIF